MSPTYSPCLNNTICDGEIAFDIETTDDGAADIYGSTTYQVAYINDKESTHAQNCVLTEEQRTALEEAKDQQLADEPYYYFEEP